MLENLRNQRIKKNVTALEMARLLGLKTKAAYYKKESGAVKITLDEAIKIADKLGTTLDDLFFDYPLSESDNGEDEQHKAS